MGFKATKYLHTSPKNSRCPLLLKQEKYKEKV